MEILKGVKYTFINIRFYCFVLFSVELPHEVTRLRADYSSNVYVTPVYEVGEVRSFLGMADYEILIEASAPYQIVTVEVIYKPHYEKTNILGLRPGLTQTGLCSHRRWLEATNFGFRK